MSYCIVKCDSCKILTFNQIFLAIIDVSDHLLSIIDDRVSSDNSFTVFKLTNQVPCFYKITRKCTTLIMRQIQQFYSNNILSEYIEDPFVHQYSDMTIMEIDIIISCHGAYYTISKIKILNNWINKNLHSLDTNKISDMMNYINTGACYMPRSHIKFMRKIRNIILEQFCKL